MDNKRRFYRQLEYYINDFNKKSVESWYGNGSVIKIHNVGFGVKDKNITIEIVIILGDVITESQMDESMAVALVSDGLVYFYPELEVNVIYRWDV